MSNSNQNFWKKVGKGAAIAGGIIAGVAFVPISFGFGTAGIIGGSIAAGIQSIIGNVAAGSIFAVCTSLGMTGVFASSAAVGALLGFGGGLATYIENTFSAEKDAELINTIIKEKDNPDIIIKLLEARFPGQREEIREEYNKLYNNFDEDIINYVPINSKIHIENLLKRTYEIIPESQKVFLLLDDGTFEDYFKNEFKDCLDAFLIETIINNNDNPLLIVRLLNYRDEGQRKKIDSKFRILKNDKNKKMLLYIIDFMPNHPEISYLHSLLDGIK